MNLQPGVSFQVVGDGYHLKVVITFPNKVGDIVIFSLTDVVGVEEKLCVFEKGEHPFFNKDDKPFTAVNYRRKLLVPAVGFNEAMVKFNKPFSPEQICKMIEGAYKSESIEPRILNELPKKGAELEAFIAKVAAIKYT